MSAFTLVAALLIGAALPVTGVLALLSGALFGFVIGWLAISVACTLGATSVFLWSRLLFQDWLQNRFEKQFNVVNSGIAEEGGYYLFSIRLFPVFPFFLINLLCGMTKISLAVYVFVTFIGNGILLLLWVYAGSTLSQLESGTNVLSLKTFLLFTCIGLAPFLIHRFIQRQRRQAGAGA